jgi:hypothetical protein
MSETPYTKDCPGRDVVKKCQLRDMHLARNERSLSLTRYSGEIASKPIVFLKAAMVCISVASFSRRNALSPTVDHVALFWVQWWPHHDRIMHVTILSESPHLHR